MNIEFHTIFFMPEIPPETLSEKLISIIIPVYNEELNIPHIYDAVTEVFAYAPHYFAYEIIFVDDASTDNSLHIIETIAEYDNRVRFVHFSKNFGKEVATTAGLHHATGDAAIMIDADLQHPPKLIPQFITKWQQGAEVVIGIRETNNGESFSSRILSSLYYRLINAISDTNITSRATDFRLLDRAVINEFNRLTERDRMTRGLIDWLGFKRDTITFSSPERANGEQRYDMRQRIRLAIASVISHSLFPLKFAGYLGVSIMVLSGGLGLFIFIEKYVFNDPLDLNFSGPAILAVILLFLTGITLACLGLIALYIGTIKNEISNRPLYVIRKSSFNNQ